MADTPERKGCLLCEPSTQAADQVSLSGKCAGHDRPAQRIEKKGIKPMRMEACLFEENAVQLVANGVCHAKVDVNVCAAHILAAMRRALLL